MARYTFIYFIFFLICTQLQGKDSGGFINIDESCSECRLYYRLSEYSGTQEENSPLTFWFNGGPGASSLLGYLDGVGPNQTTNEGDFLDNKYPWSQYSNIIAVDQPLGVGFTILKDKTKLRNNLRQVADDFYEFLVKFMEENKEFQGRDLYLTGESFAGRYIPAFCKKILQMKNPLIKLKGILIINGLNKVEDTYLSRQDKELINRTCSQFQQTQEIKYCSDIIFQNYYTNDKLNIYNYKKPQQSSSYIHNFLFPKMRENLLQSFQNCDDSHIDYQVINYEVFYRLNHEFPNSSLPDLQLVIDNQITTVIANGDLDLLVHTLGVKEAISQLKIDGQNTYLLRSEENKTIIQGAKLQQQKNLIFIQVPEAGHMIASDQPQIAREIFRYLIQESQKMNVKQNLRKDNIVL